MLLSAHAQLWGLEDLVSLVHGLQGPEVPTKGGNHSHAQTRCSHVPADMLLLLLLL